MCSPVDGYLGSFQFGAVVNKAGMNAWYQFFVNLCFYFFSVNP